MATESPISLQTDTLSTLPGGGVRTLTAFVTVNGVPTSVQQQVVTVAFPDGTLVDNLIPTDQLNTLINVMRDIKRLLLNSAGISSLEGERDAG